MANINSARKTHVSPGVYTKETDLTYAAKSLGITTLGVVGETLRGPAFQPMLIENWREFQQYFGGTSTEKFTASQYPKYELPYIAQSYLKQSNQLQVVRVLGLSGVNAGPAWVITATSDDEAYNGIAIAVLRSRGEHKKASFVREASTTAGDCEDVYEFDGLTYYAKSITLTSSKELKLSGDCDRSFTTAEGNFSVSPLNYGRFTINVTTQSNDVNSYSVSLNPNESNYIYNVLGGDPEKGDAEIYVEELYDVALQQLVEMNKISAINSEVKSFGYINVIPKFAPVKDFLVNDESMLTFSNVGERFLYTQDSKDDLDNKIKVRVTSDSGQTYTPEDGKVGHIYTVVSKINSEGAREYFYAEDNSKKEVLDTNYALVDESGKVETDGYIFNNTVRVLADDTLYVATGTGTVADTITPLSLDFNNYKEQYRYASTPWVVSEIMGSAENVELAKLFRFHTISDGSSSSTEVKVSIQNIDTDNGTFDVLVRDYNDTDAAVSVIERFRGVDLVPGSKNYIALRIGSFDGEYVNVSKYITVEVNENDKTPHRIPSGFLGYPVRNYTGVSVNKLRGDYEDDIIKPYFKYNTNVDDSVRIGKQYFGVSDLVGVDSDIFKYKGVEAYNEVPEGLTDCFHLDSRIFNGTPDGDGKITIGEGTAQISQTVTVDGIKGYSWSTVNKNNTTAFGIEPRIGTEDVMMGTIYEDKRYRKFTMAFYGGFDGWDYYRKSRSNSDEFTYKKYKGKVDYKSGEGTMFSVIRDVETYGFDPAEKVITSDWYAYMIGAKLLSNPKTIDINVLATPGIDYVNNNSLVGDIIEMVEEERADSVYVVTTPDKPFGAGDSQNEMYTPSDVVANLEDSEIDSNYTCSYYPWIKYYDNENSSYIFLPPTRDVVRNFAYTDNTRYPWFAAAGWNRGDVEPSAIKPRKTLKLSEQDTLYDGRLNFINSFANEGMKVWGDKNMQERESQMNRISKRRLLLHIRKLCAIAAIGLIFDPNDNTTKQAFESAVTPVLDNVMANRGIRDWRLEIDDSQEARDRLELPAKIFIKPTPNLEYITIDFVITPSGVSFDDI